MIEVFEGRIGGGKSYSAVLRMIMYFAQGGSVYTNIALNIDFLRAYLLYRFRWELQSGQYVFLEDKQVPEFHRHTPSGTPERPVLVVLDEAHIWFNAREWNQTSKELLSFLTQSRKTSTDVIFISQSLLNMDKQFMRLVQYVWTFRDLRKLWWAKWIAFLFGEILQCQYDYDGKGLLHRNFIRLDSGVFKCYDTFVLLRKFPRLEAVETNFKGKGKVNLTKWQVVRKMAAVLVVLLTLSLGGCRYVQVNDVRQENAKLKEAILSLQIQLQKIAAFTSGSPVSVSASVVVPPAPVRMLSPAERLSVGSLTNGVLRVCAVVNGRLCLSDGRWFEAGDTLEEWGRLCSVDPRRGLSVWIGRNGESIVKRCD